MKQSNILLIWFTAIILILLVSLFTPPQSEFGHLIVFVWLICGVAVWYRARTTQKAESSPTGSKMIGVGMVLGLIAVVYSLSSISLGISNLPFSVDELSVLLAGASLIVFGLLGYGSLMLTLIIPLGAILGYQLLADSSRPLFDPLIMPTAWLSYGILRILGLDVVIEENRLLYSAINGDHIAISIVSACTGIWSMAAFSAAVVLILLVFPKVQRKGKFFLALGYPITYVSNILRVVLICLSGYFYGHSGVLRTVHTHIGWIIFSLWMLAFWYLFFSLRLHEPHLADSGEE